MKEKTREKRRRNKGTRSVLTGQHQGRQASGEERLLTLPGSELFGMDSGEGEELEVREEDWSVGVDTRSHPLDAPTHRQRREGPACLGSLFLLFLLDRVIESQIRDVLSDPLCF